MLQLTLSPLSRHKVSFLFNLLVDVIAVIAHVRRRVLSDEVNLVLSHEIVCYLPWRIADNLIDISTVPDGLVSFDVCHHCASFQRVSELIAARADYQIDLRVWENVLGLHHLSSVTLVKQVVDAVRVDSDLPRTRSALGHVDCDSRWVIASIMFGNCFRIRWVRSWLANGLQWERKADVHDEYSLDWRNFPPKFPCPSGFPRKPKKEKLFVLLFWHEFWDFTALSFTYGLTDDGTARELNNWNVCVRWHSPNTSRRELDE